MQPRKSLDSYRQRRNNNPHRQHRKQIERENPAFGGFMLKMLGLGLTAAVACIGFEREEAKIEKRKEEERETEEKEERRRRRRERRERLAKEEREREYWGRVEAGHGVDEGRQRGIEYERGYDSDEDKEREERELRRERRRERRERMEREEIERLAMKKRIEEGASESAEAWYEAPKYLRGDGRSIEGRPERRFEGEYSEDEWEKERRRDERRQMRARRREKEGRDSFTD